MRSTRVKQFLLKIVKNTTNSKVTRQQIIRETQASPSFKSINIKWNEGLHGFVTPRRPNQYFDGKKLNTLGYTLVTKAAFLYEKFKKKKHDRMNNNRKNSTSS